jgi:uncharacterized glyoxalase superfamily metalloenzyme YdcJ
VFQEPHQPPDATLTMTPAQTADVGIPAQELIEEDPPPQHYPILLRQTS